jgi:transcriptional regulator with XRE-family HTH domain
MEFNQKLQELRKQKGLTQEELAAHLYVSRAAISKWESGRGYPNIDSLKMIAKFFGITVDQLLSGDELLTLAEADQQQKEARIRDLVYGLLDCSLALFLFLPLFGEKSGDTIRAVSLLALENISRYLLIGYYTAVIGIFLLGVLTLTLQNYQSKIWITYKNMLSLALNAITMLLFIISLQPYAATLLFVFLAVKTLLLIKKH